VLRESLTGVYRGGQRLQVWDVLVALGHTGTKQHVSDVCQITWSRGGPSSGAGVTLSCRNRRCTPTVLQLTGDELRRPGGALRGGGRSKDAAELQSFYREVSGRYLVP
jgi:hypothetical protein